MLLAEGGPYVAGGTMSARAPCSWRATLEESDWASRASES